jgi:hypothetical protein
MVMDTEQLREEIKKIQNELGIRSAKMAEFMGMKVQTYRNCISKHNPTNKFKESHLKNLKSNILSIIKKIS